MSKLARLLLLLYPRQVRDRYGDEIAELLAHSRRPWRDCADVAFCGLTDRLRWWPLIALASLAALVSIWTRFPETYSHTIFPALICVAVLMANRLAKHANSRWWQHPVAAVVCFGGWAYLLPYDDRTVARAITFAAWVLGSLGLARLARRGTRAALTLAVLGGAAFLELLAVSWIAIVVEGVLLAPEPWRLLPGTLAGLDWHLTSDPLDPMRHLFVMPYQAAVLTPVLAFAIAFGYRSARAAKSAQRQGQGPAIMTG